MSKIIEGVRVGCGRLQDVLIDFYVFVNHSVNGEVLPDHLLTPSAHLFRLFRVGEQIDNPSCQRCWIDPLPLGVILEFSTTINAAPLCAISL